MSASFIIRFHTERIENLAQMLRFMALWHKETIKNCELITVCQNKLMTPLCTEDWGIHRNFDLDLKEMMLARVTNFGVKQANHEKIIILDSDRIFPTGYFSAVIDQMQQGVQITTQKMKKLKKDHTDSEVINEQFEFDWDNRSEDFGTRNMWSGNTALMKSDFLKVGGMDESYIGYGWEDSDMCMTMKKAGVNCFYREEIELHLWHPPLTYGTEDQKKLFIDNGLRLCRKWNKPMPNVLRQEMAQHRTVEII